MNNKSENPQAVLLFCGKRKSGKDFLTDWLQSHLKEIGKSSTIIKISGPLKNCYAKNHSLNFDELMSDGKYKEQFRADMVKWSEEIRNQDPGYFCRQAEEMYQADQHTIWIISDCRRKTDFQYFESTYPGRTARIRVFASDDVRQKRGFIFKAGIDDAETECGLDNEKFDFMVENFENASPESVLEGVLRHLAISS